MNYLKDFINVQVEAIKNTFRNIRYIIIVAFAIVTGYLAINIVNNLLGGLAMTGGLSIVVGTLIYILEIFVISIIMSVLYVAIKENTSFSGFISLNNNQFFYKVIQIGFIFYIVRLVLSITGLAAVSSIVIPIIFIIFNALPETTYLEEYDGMGTIKKSLDFLKNNIINWAIPNIIIFAVFYFANINFLLLFNINITKAIPMLLLEVVKIIFYSIFLIYRGNLFEILNGSSMRKRDYMRKMR